MNNNWTLRDYEVTAQTGAEAYSITLYKGKDLTLAQAVLATAKKSFAVVKFYTHAVEGYSRYEVYRK